MFIDAKYLKSVFLKIGEPSPLTLSLPVGPNGTKKKFLGGFSDLAENLTQAQLN